jgi:hypothetical protein
VPEEDRTGAHLLVEQKGRESVRILSVLGLRAALGLLLALVLSTVERPTPVAADLPLNVNTSFEVDGSRFAGGVVDGTPDGWTRYKLDPADGITTSNPHTGSNAFSISGTSARKALFDRVVYEGGAGSKLSASGWSRADGPSPEGGYYGLLIRFENIDTTISEFIVEFSKATHDWEYRTLVATAPKGFHAVIVAAVYENQLGIAVFDDLVLFIAEHF